MESQTNLKQLTVASIFLAISVVLTWLSFSFVPFLLFIMPLPFIVAGTKVGLRYMLMSMAACFLLLMTTIDPVTALLFLFCFSGMILFLAFGIKKGEAAHKTLGKGLLSTLIGLLLFVFVFEKITGTALTQKINEGFLQMMQINREIFQFYPVDTAQYRLLVEQFEASFDLLKRTFPVLIILYSVALTCLNYILAVKVLKKMNLTRIKPFKFRDFSMPKQMFYGLCALFIIGALAHRYDPFQYEALFLNITFLTGVLFFFQGLCVMIYFLYQHKIHGVVKGAMVFFALIYGVLGILLSLVGFLDCLIHFRNRKSVNNS